MARPLRLVLIPWLFLLTLLIPSVVFIIFDTGSLSTGTAICAIAWIVVGAAGRSAPLLWNRRLWGHLGIALSTATLLFVHGVAVDLWLGGVDFARLLESCLVLLLMVLGAYAVAERLLTAPANVLVSTAHLSFVVLTIVGFSAIGGLPSLGGQTFVKPVIIFSEPSVFGFAYLPLLIFTVAAAGRRYQFMLLGIGFVLAVGLQSLVLVVGLIGASCLVLRKSQLLLLSGVLVATVGAFALDLSYYASRLALTGESDNLSTLVFLQGWQRAALNIYETGGLGVGFQQFGFVGSLGAVANRIGQLVGTSINLYDGGSTGSKLIAELGAAGVALIALYLRLVMRGVRVIRRAQRVPIEQRDMGQIFVYSLILAYTSELFLRGTGYLSSSGFLVLAALVAVPQLTETKRQAVNSRSDAELARSVSGAA